MGVCDGQPNECTAVRGVGEDGIMARRQFHHAESRQHSVGICAGKPVGYAAVHGVPESALASLSVMG